MALSRIRCSKDLPTVLSRYNNPVNGSLADLYHIRQGAELLKSAKSNAKASIHVSGIRRYPDVPKLPLPSNVSEIFNNETGRFTPERARDIAAPVLAYATGSSNSDVRTKRVFDGNCTNWGPTRVSCGDNHVDSYDCFGAVSLNSSMQSNVPLPFCSSGKASHFNMPGGQWAKDSKYIAEDLQKSHYKSLKTREFDRKRRFNGTFSNVVLTRLMPINESRLEFSTNSRANSNDAQKTGPPGSSFDLKRYGYRESSESEELHRDLRRKFTMNRVEQVKQAIRDYGATVIVFHIGLSCISLGACYVAVTSGIDIGSLVKSVAEGESENFQNILQTSSEFVIAYAVHKLLLPVRLPITLAVSPLIVRHLRKIGVLKKREKN